MKKTFLFLLMLIVLSNSSIGALNAYLELEGELQGPIQGSVTQVGREGLIMVIGYNHIVSSARDASTCMPTSKRHQPLQITKEVDASTPLLYAAFEGNETLVKFKLDFWQPSTTGTEAQFYTIELTNARIVGIHQEMLNNKYPDNMQHKEREHISFVYEKITRTYVDNGAASQSDWSGDCEQQVIRISDLNFDGIVNLLDVSILASEWLMEGY
ncbi:MAG: type VI secretion system tube protein TssD [Planctomycetota bacterium]